ncbi:MAG: S-adenosylmethionine decarboxylase [Candidatus Wildermuthbacteria bacterium]|nr:S-adenosylmethionine decarboxylase [Candidatus Wildermuthbacteria bacterium]
MLRTAEKTIDIPDCSSSAIKTPELKNKKIYGLELVLEVFGCDLKFLTSEPKIREFIINVTNTLKLGRYGPPRIKRFMGGGLFGEGYSFFQFLDSSSITGHFIEPDRIAFINIFSCGVFDPDLAADFTKNFFQAARIKSKLIVH